MKLLIVLLISLSSFQSFSRDLNPREAQSFIDALAREMRHDSWSTGRYSDVYTEQYAMSKRDLDNYVRSDENSAYDEPLTRNQISSLYRCLHGNNCQLFLVSEAVTRGPGEAYYGHFILLDTMTMEHEKISHSVY